MICLKKIVLLMLAINVPGIIGSSNNTMVCDRNKDFACKNGDCIPAFYRCDLYDDCSDGSDEDDCKCTRENNGFECADKDCIFFMFECDGEEDCNDGSDERHCSEDRRRVLSEVKRKKQ